MNKKRLLSLLLALCMVFALFACGDEGYYEDDDDDDDDEGTSQTTEDTDPTGDATDPTGDATDPTGDATDPTGGQEGNETVTPNPGTPVLPPSSGNESGNTQQPQPNPNAPDPNPGNDDNQQPEPNPGPIVPSVNTILGSWSGNTYINKYLGFRITFPETWSYFPVSSSVDPENPFPNASTVQITDLKAETTTGASVSVIYQNPSAYNGGINASNTEEQNIDLILAERDALYDVYEGMGWTVTLLDKDYVTFAGQTHCVLKTVMEVPTYGLEMYIVQLYSYGSGNTSATITIGAMSANELQDVLNMFTAA